MHFDIEFISLAIQIGENVHINIFSLEYYHISSSTYVNPHYTKIIHSCHTHGEFNVISVHIKLIYCEIVIVFMMLLFALL